MERAERLIMSTKTNSAPNKSEQFKSPSEPGWWWMNHPTNGHDLVNVHQAPSGGFAYNVGNTRAHYLSWWKETGWTVVSGPFETEQIAREHVSN